MRGFYPAALIACLLLLLTACGGSPQGPEAVSQEVQDAAEPAGEVVREPVAVIVGQAGEACFDLSSGDFIARYNALYRETFGEEILPPLEDWMAQGVGTLSRSGGAVGLQYVSQMDFANYAEPFLSLCLTQEGGKVMETVTGLSQKNYGGGPEELFRNKTFCSLSLFFPGLTQARFDWLHTQLKTEGHYYESDETPLPNRVFYENGVALYATFQIGECDQIHIQAVTDAQLAQWKAAGVPVTQGILGEQAI